MKRMTWNEIINTYPNLTLGLTQVKYIDDDGISIESALVSYTSRTTSIKELQQMAFEGKIDLVTTNPETVAVGVISPI